MHGSMIGVEDETMLKPDLSIFAEGDLFIKPVQQNSIALVHEEDGLTI